MLDRWRGEVRASARADTSNVLALTLAFAAAPLCGPDADRLARGEVVLQFAEAPGSAFPVATARVIVDAPPARVWSVVSDCHRTGEVMPDVRTAGVIAEAAGTSRCAVVVDMPFPLRDLWSVTRAALEVTPGVRWQRSWRLVEGDFTVNEGFWRLEPTADGRTLATYHIDVRPKVPLPAWLVGLIQRAKLPEMMLRLRQVARAR